MRLVLPLFLTGCIFGGGNDAVGHWAGECSITSMFYSADYGIVLDIETDEGGVISGTGEFTTYSDYTTFGGVTDYVDVQGIRKGKKLEFDLLLGTTTEFEISIRGEADLKGDTILGDCIVSAMGVSVRGDLDLVR